MLRRSILFNKLSVNRTIKSDLAISLVLIVFVFSCILIIAFSFIKQKFEVKMLNKRADDIANQIAEALSIHVWNYSEKDIEDIAESFMKMEELATITVKYDSNEKIFKKPHMQSQSQHRLIRKIEIRNKKGQNIGMAIVEISLHNIDEAKKNTMYTAFYLTLVILLIIIFSVRVVLSFLMGKPMKSLGTAINEIAQGNYEKRLKPTPQREINNIINNINAMSESISNREANLKSIQEQLTNIFEAMTSVIITIDSQYCIKQANTKALKKIPFDCYNIVGKNLFTVTGFFDKYIDLIKSANERQITQKAYYENISISMDSECDSCFNLMFYPYNYSNKSGVVIRIDDITQIAESEERLKKIQKLGIVSSLASGLSHDFNNILGGITGAVSVMKWGTKSHIDPDKELFHRNLKIIQKSANRAQTIIMQLLELAREKKYEFIPVDLNHLLENICGICRNSLEKNIIIECRKADEEAWVLADSNQIEQVLLNMCINARQAMIFARDKEEKKGGDLCIFIEKIYADEIFRENHPGSEDKKYWVISVQDTGVGIHKTEIEKVFFPFYTTKEKAYGMGLGLTIAYNIIREHKGFIDVYSESWVGTSVNIYLPEYNTGDKDKTEIKEDVDDSNLSIAPSCSIKKGIILFCDDDPGISKTACEMLLSCGYDVIAAKDGHEAVDIVFQRGTDISAVILDIIMPVLTGDEVLLRIKKSPFDIKVIISSAYRCDHRVKKALEYGADGFLSKPFTIEKINSALRNALNAD